MATERTIERARLALPHLVRYARLGDIITYGELGVKIGCHHRPVSRALGYIRDEICRPRKIPLINAIVVKQDTKMPGESWLPGGTQHLGPDEYEREFKKFRDEVFAYAGWEALLQELGLTPIPATDDDFVKQGRKYAELLEKKAPVGEGDAHRLLKEYVARNPGALGLRPRGQGEQEYLFPSGDRCDVVFDLGDEGQAVVEIKQGEYHELVKGIYQAVKYRALMQAEKGHGKPYQVEAHLVAYKIPDDIQAHAVKFDIQCHAIAHPKDQTQ